MRPKNPELAPNIHDDCVNGGSSIDGQYGVITQEGKAWLSRSHEFRLEKPASGRNTCWVFVAASSAQLHGECQRQSFGGGVCTGMDKVCRKTEEGESHRTR
jgi:hypothetical protein